MFKTLPSLALFNASQPFTRSQAADLGLSERDLRSAVMEGAVRRVLHSVYVDAAVPDSRGLRIRCLQLVMRAYGVLFGTTAAWALGVDAFQPEERFVLLPECVVPHGTGRTRVAGVRTVEGNIPPTDIMELDGLRLTVPERTTVDLLRRLRRPFALAAADAMAHAGHIDPVGVQRRIDQLKGYPGVIQARELVGLIEPLIESAGESCQRLRLHDAGFPRPTPQFWVCDRTGRRLYRLDFAYPHLLVACEYDGAEDHSSDEDRDARAHAQALGVALRRVSQAGHLRLRPAVRDRGGPVLSRAPLLPRRW